MRILIDGDAMPSIDLITRIGEKNKLEVIIFVDDSHVIESDYAKVVTVSTYQQSVDIALTNEIMMNDIIMTSDFGVAVVGLGKNAFVINSKGFIYTKDNIDIMMEERHLKSKLRRQNIRLKGPKKRTKEDDLNLIQSLEKIIGDVI